VKKLLLLCSTAACVVPSTAFAQSTGTVDFDKDAIVITGTRAQEVGGVQAPDTAKAKAVLTQEMIARQNPGQTILDTINLVPSVSFQNNDAYGSSGGTLNIRGFDSTRISLTFDGIQLNDSGNYAIYSNQQLDPELIEQVNVNLGSTDVDSPTASAVGGTVNYRTMRPTADMNFRGLVSLGQWDFRRFFGMWNLGSIGPWGTRAFVAASKADNRVPFNNYGKVDKQQYNARLWQPVGGNGDFVSVSGHYNQNRNNFFGSVRLRNDLAVPNAFPQSRRDRFYNINYPCTVDVPQAGVADTFNSCGTEFDRRFNPSNTGNIRGASRFTLGEGIVLTIDPSYQYVKANGGGTVTGREGFATVGGVQYTGFIGGQYWFGRDLNNDGDMLDTCVNNATNFGCTTATAARGVTLLAPSQTQTHRYGVITGLRWQITADHMVRVGYTLDRARHRQTGEVGTLDVAGNPNDVFTVNNPLRDGRGNVLQKRDRKSFAILNQVAGEYRGELGALTVNAGLRMPFFKRDLTNNCFTTSPSGFVDCFAGDAALEAAYAARFPNVQGPQQRVFKYNKLLPNVGAVYRVTNLISAFASYSKGISVPGTDLLYNSFFFARDQEQAKPDPELTDSFDLGGRYRSGKIQAQVSGWFTKYDNRVAQAYDPELDRNVFRNLGQVDKYGIDGAFAYAPVRELTFYLFGSRNISKIKENIQLQPLTGGLTCDTIDQSLPAALRSCAFTKGRYESGAPKYTYGISGVGRLSVFELGVTAKRTGPRYVFDTNLPTYAGDLGITAPTAGRVVQREVFGATAPAYWLVHLDSRVKLDSFGMGRSYLQFNVYNLFDKLYVGGFGGGLSQATGTRTCNATSTPSCVPTVTVPTYGNAGFAQIGAPRTISATFNVGF